MLRSFRSLAVLFVFAAGAVSGCRCGGGPVSKGYGEIAIVYPKDGVNVTGTDAIYDYGKVAMGQRRLQKLVIKNVGRATLSLAKIAPVDAAQEATAVGPDVVSQPGGTSVFLVAFAARDLAPGESVEVDSYFDAPVETDASKLQVDHAAQLLLTASGTEAGAETARITLKGTAVSGACIPRGLKSRVDSTVSPPRTTWYLDFGAVARNDKGVQEVVFTNPSPIDAKANVGAIESGSTDKDAFNFEPDSASGDFTVPPGKERTVKLGFTPTRIADYLAFVNMQAAEGCEPLRVELIGAGVDSVLTWEPIPVDFGYVSPGSTVQKELTFKNYAIAEAQLTEMKTSTSEYKPTAFSVGGMTLTVPTGTMPANVPGATRDPMTKAISPGIAKVTIDFKPALLGLRPATLNFKTNFVKQSSGAATLKGFGGGPDIDVRPASGVNFGKVPYFAPPALPSYSLKKLTVQNVGTRPAMPDPAANLHLGANGAGAPYWTVKALNSVTDVSELCVGEAVPELDPMTNSPTGKYTCTNTLPISGKPGVPGYDPAVGLVAAGADSLLDIPLRVTPKDAAGLKEWEVTVYSSDPDEPAVKVTVKAEAVVVPPCNFTITPTNLNFGLVTPPDYKDLSFSIKNNKTNPGDICLITNLDIETPASASQANIFSLPAGPVDQKTLAPGEVFSVLVRAWPQVALTGEVQGAVQFNISSPDTPVGRVALKVRPQVGCLTIAPDELDFGTVQKDCSSAPRTFSVYNTCQGSVTVTTPPSPDSGVITVGITAGAGQPAGGPNCPGSSPCPEFLAVSTAGVAPGTIISPGTMPKTFQLKYHPIDYGVDNGAFTLQVNQNGSNVDYIVTLKGNGDMNGLNVDTFRQDTKPKADILLIIDNSCSMSDKQAALAANFGSFIKYAISAQVDWQIGVTSTDDTKEDGRILPLGLNDPANPKILKSTTANVENLFKARVNLGTNGSAEEMMAKIAVDGLTGTNITGENLGLIRPDAILAVVAVTDANDQSPDAVSFYVNKMLNIKGVQRATQFSYNAIAPFLPAAPAGCSYDSPSAGSDPKHLQLVSALGGVKEEICSPDWSKSLEQVGKNAFGYRTNFFLTATPDLTGGKKIVVKIDGVELLPTDSRGATVWTYDAAGQSVNFEPLFVPEPGKTLTITYYVACLP